MKIKDISYFTRHERIAGNESGRSLVEMLGTIGIITMITVGAISGASTGMALWKANQTHEQIMEIIQGITDIYSWNRDGWVNADFDNIPQLCKDAGFSSCDDSNNIQLSLGTLDSIVGLNDGTALKITVSGIPYNAYHHLYGKKDGHIITDIDCPGCTDGSRGAKTLIFTHDPHAGE
ncbi:MAG: hypothetical protein IKL32_01795 [Alphaproteobacteria bacterium]|nr:hypothetical protein [Alphaproteobacteria bacterium]